MLRQDRFYEQIFFSTARVVINGGESIGTGFLWRKSLSKHPTQNVILLISCKHVFANSKYRINIMLHKREEEDFFPKLGQVIQIDQMDFTNIYYEHPDPNVDLACINVSNIANPPNLIYYRVVGEDLSIDFESPDLFPGLDVWFVGYPHGRYDTHNFLPILRKGFIASIPNIDYNNLKQFIVDAQVFPGSSGSPVFANVNGNFKFLGTIAQTMVANNVLQVVPSNTALTASEVIGLGIVLKAELVYQMVDHVSSIIDDQIK